jgi:hypothetical protein
MKISSIAFILLVGCGTEPAADDGFRAGSKADDPSGWSHVVLGSSDGLGISVDYVNQFLKDSSFEPRHLDLADPVYANLWGDGLTGDEEVRVVLMNYELCDKQVAPYTFAVDLGWQGDHFSANLGRDAAISRSDLEWSPGSIAFDLRWSGYGGDFSFCQELAVVVDGRWLVDPVSDSNNFTFDMYAAR